MKAIFRSKMKAVFRSKMKVIFIGNDYYYESGTRMSSVYQIEDEGRLKRTHWGFIQIALAKGEEVHIRPANEKELEQMDSLLGKILIEREKNKRDDSK